MSLREMIESLSQTDSPDIDAELERLRSERDAIDARIVLLAKLQQALLGARGEHEHTLPQHFKKPGKPMNQQRRSRLGYLTGADGLEAANVGPDRKPRKKAGETLAAMEAYLREHGATTAPDLKDALGIGNSRVYQLLHDNVDKFVREEGTKRWKLGS